MSSFLVISHASYGFLAILTFLNTLYRNYLVFCFSLVPYVRGTLTLPVPELRHDDLQDNILVTVKDGLTALLEEEMVVELAANPNQAELAAGQDHAPSDDTQSKVVAASSIDLIAQA